MGGGGWGFLENSEIEASVSGRKRQKRDWFIGGAVVNFGSFWKAPRIKHRQVVAVAKSSD